ncbi:hypothetical protein [Microbaculum sp. FT89]|uniref:hypothetical protein n=1 Tax=Microbaculum sp. FT89 TaxID=3447298 RepID=UPI003F5352E8
MSEEMIIEDVPEPHKRESRLREALNRARQQAAERSDVIVDLREAELARLELLQDALSEVFEEIPEDTDLLECSLVPSTPPRLWVDVLGHVMMGRDKRTYRFLKDTRHGRQVILETTNLDEIAARVTDYVAHRLLERERALESDADGKTVVRLGETETPAGPDESSRRSGAVWGTVIFTFLVGAFAGAAGLFLAGMLLTAP